MIDLRSGVPGVNAPDPTTYEEFWPFYVSQHLHPATRAAHVLGTTLAILAGVVGVATWTPALFVAVPLLGYGFAVPSHYIWEGNRPATFRNPWWSFRADLRQWRRAWIGRLAGDVDAVRAAAELDSTERTLAYASDHRTDHARQASPSRS